MWLRSRGLRADFDCLTLFLGAQMKAVVDAHQQVVECFRSGTTPSDILDRLTSSRIVEACYAAEREGDRVFVQLRDSLYLQQAPVDDVGLELQLRRGRRRFVAEVPVRRLATLGALFPALRGTMSAEAAAAQLRRTLSKGEAEWAAELLRTMIAQGFLEAGRKAGLRGASPRSAQATFLGHSSLLVQAERASVLVDPLLRFDLGLPRAAFDVTRLALDAIVCSHSHWDHCDPQTYLWFDKSIPVLVPRVRRPTALNPPVAPMFARLGFRDVREIDPWERVEFGPIDVTAIPFHGEQDEPGEEFDHFTYVIRGGDLRLYGGVDISRDTFGEMPPVLERVRDEFRPNLAFLPCSDVAYRYEQGGGSHFCRYFDSTRASQTFQYTASPEDAARWAQLLDSDVVVPYALFLLSPWTTHPSIRALQCALQARGLGDRFWPLRPMQSISTEDLADGRCARFRRRRERAWFRLADRFARP